ncbi:hypothetical protein [Bacillus sp. AG4(2022)]|uniref:hypothetical protein n=1 Tax=Bacillus sp. AG4(2022) TaxID=2962594 RepID=UPI002880C885|nr:hypothetical protein [Bacillus sp. AG4(2022)]MDT0161608.1 hypothetical protein [Bacillus sp. AG4(2022)]
MAGAVVLCILSVLALVASVWFSYLAYKQIESKDVQNGILWGIISYMAFSFFLYFSNNIFEILSEVLKNLNINISWLSSIVNYGHLIVAGIALAKLLTQLIPLAILVIKQRFKKETTKPKQTKINIWKSFIISSIIKFIGSLIFIIIYVVFMELVNWVRPRSTEVQLINTFAILLFVSNIVIKYAPNKSDNDKNEK